MLGLIIKTVALALPVIACLACGAPPPTIAPANSNLPRQPAASAQSGSAGQGSAGQGSNQSGNLRFRPDAGWVAEQPSSSMRVEQYRLPHAEGDSSDAQ